jgi:SPP1 gp7 family putative phage head morphogenesis protein
MLQLKDQYYTPIEKQIQQYFYETYYNPIIELLQDPLYNSRSTVITALRAGKISYSDGVFSGKFNIAMSRDLSKYAKYDSRSRTWKGNPPPDVLAAAVVANSKNKKLHDKINILLNDLQTEIEDSPKILAMSIESPTKLMDTEMKKDLVNLGITPELSPFTQQKLIEDYNKNQNLNIKNWNNEQIERLRDTVSRFALKGYRKSALIEMIANEWEVSKNKAKFLARQETSLYMSKLRRERFLDAGVTKYKWSTSHDERVRKRHAHLNGTIQTFGSPPVTDDKGNRNEPGEDFNCRCVAIPLL